MESLRTLGQFVEDEQIIAWVAGAVGEIHQHATREARFAGARLKLTVSCTSCTATKTCCWSPVVARLYEGVLIADRLRRTGRDTPVLRDELRTRAEAMEAASPREWRTPCLFLDERERCTIYDVRPTSCGNLHVYTDPAWCTTMAGEIKGYVPTAEMAAATKFEETFRDRLSLRKKVGRAIGVAAHGAGSRWAWNRHRLPRLPAPAAWPASRAIAVARGRAIGHA